MLVHAKQYTNLAQLRNTQPTHTRPTTSDDSSKPSRALFSVAVACSRMLSDLRGSDACTGLLTAGGPPGLTASSPARFGPRSTLSIGPRYSSAWTNKSPTRTYANSPDRRAIHAASRVKERACIAEGTTSK